MHPFFSIIIPTYNRRKQLSNCLQSLSNLNYAPDRYEVIVVDDGSDKPIDDVIGSYRAKMNLTGVTQKNSGPAAARNAGALKARGEILAFTDDDCLPNPDWLRKLAIRFAKTSNCVIGGRTINILESNFYSFVSQLIVDVVYRHYNANPNDARFFASNNLAVPRQIFWKVGGFDPAFHASEDRDLCDRLLINGIRLIFAPEIVINHAHSLTFISFLKLHFDYGKGAYDFLRTRFRRNSFSLVRDSRFYLDIKNWLYYPFSRTEKRYKFFLALMIVFWQLANVSGAFWGAFNDTFIFRNQR